MNRVWILNPDAEVEMRFRGNDYTSTAAATRRMTALRPLFAPLVAGEPAHFVHELGGQSGAGGSPLFWCPTPSARRAARRAGFTPGAAPSAEVLRLVLSRRFLFDSDLPAPRERTFIGTTDELDQWSTRTKHEKRWRAKHAYGFAGRGHRVWSGQPGPDEMRILGDWLSHGGFSLEPEVEVVREWSIHGLVLGDAVRLGSPCRLWVDQYHQPLRIERTSAGPLVAGRLHDLAEHAARALSNSGYFGPFGLDLLETPDGLLQPSDLNARFTLGWSTGMGDEREEALDELLRWTPPQ
jgi:hypothetical protein